MYRYVTDEQLDHWFAHHPPANRDVASAHEIARSECRRLAQVALLLLPDCPDKGVVLQRIREVMWAMNAAIACAGAETFAPDAVSTPRPESI